MLLQIFSGDIGQARLGLSKAYFLGIVETRFFTGQMPSLSYSVHCAGLAELSG